MTADGARPGGAAVGSLVGVLARLADPATSTRRTAGARQRLADHPATRALLEAGVRVLLQEVGASAVTVEAGGGDGGGAGGGVEDGVVASAEVPARFFDLLSANRVCVAATAVGPLQVTPAHLRDRWSRQADYLADLFAFVLWHQHWTEVLDQRHRRLPAPQRASDLPQLADALAEAHLITGALPVTFRLEVMASALAPARPRLRSSRALSFARFEAFWATVVVELLGGAGLRPRPGHDVVETARAMTALFQGANQRLLVLGESPERRTEAVRLVSVGLQSLWNSAFEPVPEAAPPTRGRGAPGSGAPGRGAPHLGAPCLRAAGQHFSWPQPGRGDVAAVLTRITDEATGTRRTEQTRRRLARDGITRQLLQGGLGVLGQELGVSSIGPSRRAQVVAGGPPRFFDVLSVARVVAEARAAGGDGAEVTPAQLRDRWASQEQYVDDLLAYAVSRTQPAVATLMRRVRSQQTTGAMAAARAAAEDAAQERLRSLGAASELRLRLLLTALAQTRPAVAARLAELHDQEEEAVCGVLEHLLQTSGQQLRPGVDLTDLCRAHAALGEGLVARALATGDTGLDDDGRGSLLLRTSTALYRGSLGTSSSQRQEPG